MSVEAITWAFAQPISHSTAKFVLVSMANHADADMMCWPSTVHLCQQTAQDRKTIQANIQRLREWGYIEDTGERRGTTKQVIVYRLKTPENGPVNGDEDAQIPGESEAENSTNNGPVSDVNSTEIGPVEDAQNRACTKNQTGPNFPPKRPVFPTKQAQISHETGPKTGHGTIKEPSRNHQGNKNIRTEPAFDLLKALLDQGVEKQTAEDWLEVRRKKRAASTQTALNGLIREAGKAGLTLQQAVEICAERNWQSLQAEWLKDKVGAKGETSEDQRRAENEEAYRLLYGKKASEVIDV